MARRAAPTGKLPVGCLPLMFQEGRVGHFISMPRSMDDQSQVCCSKCLRLPMLEEDIVFVAGSIQDARYRG